MWFNGFRHLPNSSLESMGPVEGERLTKFIVDHGIPWNANPTFRGRAVMTGGDSTPPVATLPGGLSCTILSPGRDQLAQLRRKWVPVVDEANLNPATVTPGTPSGRPAGWSGWAPRTSIGSLPSNRRSGQQRGQRQQYCHSGNLGRPHRIAHRRCTRRRTNRRTEPLARPTRNFTRGPFQAAASRQQSQRHQRTDGPHQSQGAMCSPPAGKDDRNTPTTRLLRGSSSTPAGHGP